jgi:hypothetical protein
MAVPINREQQQQPPPNEYFLSKYFGLRASPQSSSDGDISPDHLRGEKESRTISSWKTSPDSLCHLGRGGDLVTF